MVIDIKKWALHRSSYETLQVLEEATSKAKLSKAEVAQKSLDHIIKKVPVPAGAAVLGADVLADLEMTKNYTGTGDNTVFETLCTVSLQGSRHYLEQLMSFPIGDHSVLKTRQTTLQEVWKRVADHPGFSDKLKTLASYEQDIMWMFDANDEELASLYDMVYFKTWVLKFLNTTPLALTSYNVYRILVSPVIGLVAPISYFVIPFLVMRIKFKIKLSFKQWLRFMWDSLFSKDSIMNVFGGLSKIKYISYAFSMIFYFQGIFSSVELAKASYKISKLITGRVNNIARFVKTSQAVLDTVWVDKVAETFGEDLEEACPKVELGCDSVFECNRNIMLTNFGQQLKIFKNLSKKDMIPIVKRMYMIDAISSIERSKTKLNMCDAVFDYETKTPRLEGTNVWHPCLDHTVAIKNTLCLGSNHPQNVILTGPNAGGKSTLIKSMLLSAVLSQTLCIANAESIILTPFFFINSQINIPDCKGKESLFEAEMYRSKSNLDMLAETQGKPSLIAMDEIFNSTNPVEGIAGAYAIAKRIASFESNLSLISTHYLYLAKLAKDTKGAFVNYKMNVVIDADGTITYPYKLCKGISRQYIALELLKKNGFDDEIVQEGIRIKNKLSV